MTAPVKHVWIALAVVYVVWGSTYFGIKIAVDTIPPLLAAGSRFLVAALLLAAILALARDLAADHARELGASAIAGGLLLGLGVGLVHVAETRIDSSVAAMIAGTVPLQIIVLRLIAGESPARATRLSTLAGLFGLGLVVAPGLGAGSTALGLAVMISATMSLVARARSSRSASRSPATRSSRSSCEMAFGGAFLMIGAAAFGEYGELSSATFALDSMLAWVYLVVMGSLVGFSAYAWLLRVAPISLVVTHQYVNPLVAIALGMAFLGERPSPWTLAGAGLVIGAVYVAIRAEFPRKARLLDLRASRREELQQIRPCEDPGRPAAGHDDDRAAPARETLVDLIDRRVGVDGRKRRLHRDRDVLVQRVRVLEDAVEELALLQRADDVRERVDRLVADDRELRDPVALHRVDRRADLLVRADRDEVRHLVAAARRKRSTSSTAGGGVVRSRKPYWIIQLSS